MSRTPEKKTEDDPGQWVSPEKERELATRDIQGMLNNIVQNITSPNKAAELKPEEDSELDLDNVEFILNHDAQQELEKVGDLLASEISIHSNEEEEAAASASPPKAAPSVPTEKASAVPKPSQEAPEKKADTYEKVLNAAGSQAAPLPEKDHSEPERSQENSPSSGEAQDSIQEKQNEDEEDSSFSSSPTKENERSEVVEYFDVSNLSCNVCGKVMHSAEGKRNHLKSVHDNMRRFKCTICQKSLWSSTHLKIHVRLHSSTSSSTSSSSPSSSIISPSKLPRSAGPLKCDYCLNYFPTLEKVLAHVVELHSFQCPECPKHFSSINGLNGHFKTQHGGMKKSSYHVKFVEVPAVAGRFEERNTTVAADAPNGPVVKNGKPTKLTPKLDATLTTLVRLSVLPASCRFCPLTTLFHTQAEFDAHCTEFHPFKCPLCEKMLKLPTSMRKHFRGHHPEAKPYFCKLCTKIWTSEEELVKHKCAMNGRSYKALSNITNGEGAEDLDLEDPYDRDVSSADTTAPTPDMLFSEGPPTTEKYDPNQPLSKTNLPSFEYLRSAYEIATPDVILDPIVEVLCVIPPAPQYIYVDPDNSEGDSDSEGEPIQCKLCEDDFDSEQDLMEHMSDQHPFECPICHRPYRYLDSLRKHCKFTHDNLSVQVCKLCSIVFTDPANKESHNARIHPPKQRSSSRSGANTSFSGGVGANLAGDDTTTAAAKEDQLSPDSSFGCLFCPKRYNVADSLRKHMKNVHESSAATCKICYQVFRSHEKKRAHLTSPGHLEKIGQANNTMNTSGLNVSGSGTPTPATPQINYNNSFLSMDLSKLASVVPVAYAAPRPSAKMVSTVSAGSKRTLAERSSGSPAPTARTTSSTPNHSSVRKTPAPAAADNAIPARRSSTASSAPKHASTPTSKPVNSKSIHDESERAEKGKVYICPWCDDPFELGSKLRRHSSKVHHKKTTICPFCTETFRTDEARDSHEAKAHGDQVYKPEAKSSPEKESPRKSLSSRQKDVGYEEADSTASSVDEDAEGEIECENCPLLFSTEEDLKEHISEMHPFQCPQCPEKRYKSSKGVQKHYRERHPREEVFICKPCVVCFSKKSAFQKHQNEHVLDEEEDDSQQELEATPAKVRRVSEDIQTPPPSTRAKRASGNPAEARILRVSEDTPASPPRSKRSSGSSSSDLASSTPVTRLKRSSGSDSLISPATPLLEKRMKRDSVETSLESPLVKRDRRMSGVRVLVPVATKVRIPSGTTVMSAEMSKEVELACIKETLEAESVANDEDFKAGEGRPKSPDFYGFATVEASESGKCEEIKKGLASAIEAIKAEDS